MTVRAYLPLTSTSLAALVAEGRIPGPTGGHAVTAALRETWPEGDEEQWEYAALAAAADDSWQARTTTDRPRRHVLAVDVASVVPADGEVTAVTVAGDVLWKHVAAAHVDVEDLAEDPGDDGGPELAWFATQEISELV